jgi:hypothetical protein
MRDFCCPGARLLAVLNTDLSWQHICLMAELTITSTVPLSSRHLSWTLIIRQVILRRDGYIDTPLSSARVDTARLCIWRLRHLNAERKCRIVGGLPGSAMHAAVKRAAGFAMRYPGDLETFQSLIRIPLTQLLVQEWCSMRELQERALHDSWSA